jgi:hypothetical protein
MKIKRLPKLDESPEEEFKREQRAAMKAPKVQAKQRKPARKRG